MDLKTAIKIANTVYSLEKVRDIKDTIINNITEVDISEQPDEKTMDKLIEEVSKAFVKILEELENELRSY